MHQPNPSCSRWMEESFSYIGTTDDEDGEVHFGTSDFVSGYVRGDSDSDINGPYSVTSFPPSVGPDQESFLPTPQTMYAPSSPTCATPPNCSDFCINQPTDEVYHLSSAKKALIFSEQGRCLQTESHENNVDYHYVTSESEGTYKTCIHGVESYVRSTSSVQECRSNSILGEEVLGMNRSETCSSFLDNEAMPQESVDINSEQPVHMTSVSERRMSLQEFVDQLCDEENNTIMLLLNSAKQDVHVENEEVSSGLKDEVTSNTNIEAPTQSKTRCARKRKAEQTLFSNPDFSDLENDNLAKRQMVMPSQNNYLPNFKDGKMDNFGSYVDDSSLIKGISLASDVDNINSEESRSSSVGQNPVYNFSATTARLRHYSLPDAGQFGHMVQESRTSSQGSATPTTSALDQNGNLVNTNSQRVDNHISPWFVQSSQIHRQQQTITTRNEETRLHTQDQTTSRVPATQPRTALIPLTIEPHPDHLHSTAKMITPPQQQVIHMPSDYHVATARSTVVHSNSLNQNSLNQNSLNQNCLKTTLVGQLSLDLQTSCIPYSDVVAYIRETASSTTTTSTPEAFRLKDNCQQRGTVSNSHLSSPAASTDLLPYDAHSSDILCLPVDAVTAEMFAKSNTASASLYQTHRCENTDSDKLYQTHTCDVTDSDKLYQTHTCDVTDIDKLYQTHTCDNTDSDKLYQTHTCDVTDSDKLYQTHTCNNTDSYTLDQTHIFSNIDSATLDQTHTFSNTDSATLDQTHTFSNIDSATLDQTHTFSNTDSATLDQTHTFSNTNSDDTEVVNTNDVSMSHDVVHTLPSDSQYSTSLASLLGYSGTDLLDQQEFTSNEQEIFSWEMSTRDDVIQETSSVVESTNDWNTNGHVWGTNRDGTINSNTLKSKYETLPDNQTAGHAENTVLALEVFNFPSLSDDAYANVGFDYLTETPVDVVSASRSPHAHVHDLDVSQEILFAQHTSSETAQANSVEVLFVSDGVRSALTDSTSVADSESTMVTLFDVTDPAYGKSIETGQLSAMVKHELKCAILNKRQKEGKTDIEISFQPERQHELTEEEQEKEKRRKELNRKAAANHRHKKKASKQSADKEYEDLLKKQAELRETVAQLENEKVHVMSLLQAGGWR